MRKVMMVRVDEGELEATRGTEPRCLGGMEEGRRPFARAESRDTIRCVVAFHTFYTDM
jgi:hypothetical protein